MKSARLAFLLFFAWIAFAFAFAQPLAQEDSASIIDASESSASKEPTSKTPEYRLPDQITFHGDLEMIEWNEEDGFTHFHLSGNAVVQADETTIRAQELIYDPINQTVEAKGNPVLTDPLGEIRAETIYYDLKTGQGNATGFVAASEGARVRARSMVSKANEIVVRDADATTCDRKHPHYELEAKKIVVRPGRNLTFYNVYLRILGQRVFWVPYFQVSIAPRREGGYPTPVPGYSQNRGLFIRASQDYAINPSLSVDFSAAVFLRSVPELSLRAVQSLTPGRDPLSASLDETSGRFNNAFMDNISAFAPEDDELRVLNRLSGAYIETSTNREVFGRRVDRLRVTKDIEAGVQLNLPFKDLLNTSTFRIGHLREFPRRQSSSRLAFETSFFLREQPLLGQFSWRPKFDTAAFIYEFDKTRAWIRPSIELFWRPHVNLRFGVSYARSKEFGSDVLAYDRIEARENLNFRIDTRIGGTSLSALLKYDLKENDLYDVQIRFGQILHCIEPVITYRKRPDQFQFSINLLNLGRIQNAFARRAEQLTRPERGF